MTEKPCAHPNCTCPAEPGKEFCSDLVAERQEQANRVTVPIPGAVESSVGRGLK